MGATDDYYAHLTALRDGNPLPQAYGIPPNHGTINHRRFENAISLAQAVAGRVHGVGSHGHRLDAAIRAAIEWYEGEERVGHWGREFLSSTYQAFNIVGDLEAFLAVDTLIGVDSRPEVQRLWALSRQALQNTLSIALAWRLDTGEVLYIGSRCKHRGSSERNVLGATILTGVLAPFEVKDTFMRYAWPPDSPRWKHDRWGKYLLTRLMEERPRLVRVLNPNEPPAFRVYRPVHWSRADGKLRIYMPSIPCYRDDDGKKKGSSPCWYVEAWQDGRGYREVAERGMNCRGGVELPSPEDIGSADMEFRLGPDTPGAQLPVPASADDEDSASEVTAKEWIRLAQSCLAKALEIGEFDKPTSRELRSLRRRLRQFQLNTFAGEE